jgi:parallel beta-helix repeat protein
MITTNLNMRRGLLLFFVVLFLFGTEAQSSGLKIYVAVSGSDSNPGTKELPMASLNGAADRLQLLRKTQTFDAPVEIIIGNGSYFITEPLILSPEDSGTEESPVIFKAEEGANPVFYGGKLLEGFEKISENLWRAKIPEVAQRGWYFEQLYVNGRRAVRAKSPNKGFYYLKDVSETIVEKGKGRTADLAVQKFRLFEDGIRDIATWSESDFDDAVLTLYHKWDNTRKRIAAFNPDSSAIYTVGGGMKPWNTPDRKTRYTIENYKAALDTCGEWFLDRSGYLYYMPCVGETIEKLQVIAPVVSQFVVIQGDEKSGRKAGYIRFENLSFQVSGYQMPLGGNEPAQAASPVEAVVIADFAQNIQLVNCEIAHTGTNAVWFRKACSDCRIEHCYFHELGAGGVKIGTSDQPENPENLTRRIVVDNNIIRSGGFVFPCAVGVTLFNASDNQITHNEIADFRYSGVSVGWVWGYTHSPSKRNKIEFNHIHHLGWGELCDMGGVYCLGSSEGTTVSNNVVHHVYSYDYGGWGLYTDEGSTGIVMENNLVYNCKSSGFHQHYGKENIIRNNIFANNLKAQLQATRVEEHLSFTFAHNIIWFSTGDLLSSNWDKIKIQSDDNCYWDGRAKDIRFKKLSFAEWQKSGKDVHSVVADPRFVNPSAFDFRIKNRAVTRKIGFKEFDYSQAGVYGSEEWKKRAAFDPAVAKRFDEAVEPNEKRVR